MGLMDKLKRTSDDGGNAQKQERLDPPRQLTEEEREQVIEDARSELPDLDKAVEENLARLRQLSRS